jgi:hypothetical protein
MKEEKKRGGWRGSGFGRLTVQGVLYINNIIRALPLSLSLVWMCVYIYVYTQVVSQVTHTTWEDIHKTGSWFRKKKKIPNGERRIPMCGGRGEREIRFVSLELELN